MNSPASNSDVKALLHTLNKLDQELLQALILDPLAKLFLNKLKQSLIVHHELSLKIGAARLAIALIDSKVKYVRIRSDLPIIITVNRDGHSIHMEHCASDLTNLVSKFAPGDVLYAGLDPTCEPGSSANVILSMRYSK